MLRSFGHPESLFPDQRPVATLGMFDGVHLGHQAVFSETIARARELSAPSLAVTFDQHPRALLDPAGTPPMITSLKHRLALLENFGLDAALVLTFNPELAATPAAEFTRSLFAAQLRVKAVVLGYRAHFGQGRQGDIGLLRQLGQECDFRVWETPPVDVNGAAVSSSAIRNSVAAGELAAATAMLGRPVSVLGAVVRGRGLGAELGFPTLNLNPHHELKPPRGVYVTRTRCGDTVWESVTNIGHRPTLNALSADDVLVETHLLEKAGTLYGQTVEVLFLKRLREEMKFADKDELATQIRRDVAAAREYFRKF